MKKDLVKIDKKDKEILKILESDSRTSKREIAKKTSLNLNEVEKKIKRFEDKEVITKYTILMDFSVLNRKKLGIFIVSLKKKKDKDFIKHLLKEPKITWVAGFPSPLSENTDYCLKYSLSFLLKLKEVLL